MVSFNQAAVDRFHELVPEVPVAPGIDGIARFLLGGASPGPGVVALQIPITFETGGQTLEVTTPESVLSAHRAGYAVHVWLSNDEENRRVYDRLLDMCVDGIMAARAARAREAAAAAQGRGHVRARHRPVLGARRARDARGPHGGGRHSSGAASGRRPTAGR